MTGDDRFASPVDLERYGAYRIVRAPDDRRPVYRFTGRITTDGASGFAAQRGRYHLYAGWFCPWSHRATIELALLGLDDVVTVSYVDDARDARGWAFRAHRGPDPVNGFRLLREAYEATEPGYDGHVSTPTLWDRTTGRIVSNDFDTIDLDLATAFAALGTGTTTYPTQLRPRTDELNAWLGVAVNRGVGVAVGAGDAAAAARVDLVAAFEELDARLAHSRYLLDDLITVADVRLWVTLVRHDAAANADRTITPGIAHYPNLWRYARDLYRHPAFRRTTDFDSFTTASVTLPDWDRAPEGVRSSVA